MPQIATQVFIMCYSLLSELPHYYLSHLINETVGNVLDFWSWRKTIAEIVQVCKKEKAVFDNSKWFLEHNVKLKYCKNIWLIVDWIVKDS